MARNPLFRRVLQQLQIANFCQKQDVDTAVGLEMLEERRAQAVTRRRLLAGAGGTMALAGCYGGPGSDELGEARASLKLEDLDVGIVGGGFAGIACADRLRKWGCAATIHEASTRLGGRCHSLSGQFPGQVVERGGELIDNLHKTLLGWANELSLVKEDYTKEPGDVAYHFGGQAYDEMAVVDEYRDLVDVMKFDMNQLGAPTADSFTPFDQQLDYTSLEQYLDTRGAGPVVRAAIEVAYNIEYGLEIDEQSCLNLLLFIHVDKRSRFQPFGVFSDERYHIVGGNDAIIQGLAARQTGVTHFGRKLVSVAKLSDGRIELTFDEAGTTVVAVHDAVVLAIPFSTLRDVNLDASLAIPSDKQTAIDNLLYGTNAKLMIGFDGRPWFDQHGSTGTAYTDLPNMQNSWETNAANANASRGVITDYSGGDRGASLDPNDPQAAAEAFLTAFDTIYPGAAAQATRNAQNELNVHLEHWPSNPLSKGSYTCNHPGYFTTICDNEQKPVDNLYFAGEHTSSFYEWQGFMEGAALSGLRAADEIWRDFR